MSNSENLHAGHRDRMIDKFLKNPDAFLDHELLELLLFIVVPRKDTNPLAHRLLNMFGDFETLSNATAEQLQKVSGVGKRVASELMVLFKIAKRLRLEEQEKPVLSNNESVYDIVEADFRDLDEENFFILMLDGRFKLLAKLRFTDNEADRVKANLTDIVAAINIHKPYFVIIVHNHPSGDANPSEHDDLATLKISFLCELHGVNLLDHIIFSKNGNFSYRSTDRMQNIKEKTHVNSVFSTIIKEN